MSNVNASTQVYTPATGQTTSIVQADGNILCVIEPSLALATLTVALPPIMGDGQVMRIVATKPITLLTVTGPNGITIVGAVSTLLANVSVAYCYSAQTNKIYRID